MSELSSRRVIASFTVTHEPEAWQKEDIALHLDSKFAAGGIEANATVWDSPADFVADLRDGHLEADIPGLQEALVSAPATKDLARSVERLRSWLQTNPDAGIAADVSMLIAALTPAKEIIR